MPRPDIGKRGVRLLSDGQSHGSAPASARRDCLLPREAGRIFHHGNGQ